jgi:hypothetical protein
VNRRIGAAPSAARSSLFAENRDTTQVFENKTLTLYYRSKIPHYAPTLGVVGGFPQLFVRGPLARPGGVGMNS